VAKGFNDLSDQLEHFIKRAIQEPDATVYAFGQRRGPEPQTRAKIFNFLRSSSPAKRYFSISK